MVNKDNYIDFNNLKDTLSSKVIINILKLFLKDSNIDEFISAYLSNNKFSMLKYIHTLKGVSGNISANELYKLSVDIESLLKNDVGNYNFDQLSMLFNKYMSVYMITCNLIKDFILSEEDNK